MKNQSLPTALDRRQFVRASAGASALGLAALASCQAPVSTRQAKPSSSSLIGPGDVVLFQGDSITDAGRKRDRNEPNDQRAMGNGYAWFAAIELLTDYPDDNLVVYNRGISGNKVFQLADRWREDCLDLDPNVLSILIGVNDYWHKRKHDYEGTVETYETDYRALVDRTKKALPNVQFVICEPFVLLCGEVTEEWIEDFDGYRAAARRVADESDATFVPFQSMFNDATDIAPPEHWAADGVHPTPAGAVLMAHAWLKAVGA